MPNNSTDTKGKFLGDFNEYINLILLSMFAIVVVTILCVKCCSSCNHYPKTNTETPQLSTDTVNNSTLTQQ